MGTWIRVPRVLIAAGLGISLLQGVCSAELRFESTRPLFARIAVTRDSSKVLLIGFDESKGKGTGYDTLYADTNLDGRLDESEKITGQASQHEGFYFCSFRPIDVPTRFNQGGKGPSARATVQVTYGRFAMRPGSKPEETFFANLGVASGNKSCTLSCNLRPASTASKAKTVGLKSSPRIAWTAKPDSKNKGRTGIAISVTAGDWQLGSHSWNSLPVAFSITDAKGRLVMRRKGKLDDFSFG